MSCTDSGKMDIKQQSPKTIFNQMAGRNDQEGSRGRLISYHKAKKGGGKASDFLSVVLRSAIYR
jgi:hypothetical protein